MCRPGFGKNFLGQCSDCTLIPGSFLLNGYCVLCPVGQTAANGQCSCPSGQTLQNGVCTSTCLPNQLTDSNGFCYSCLIN